MLPFKLSSIKSLIIMASTHPPLNYEASENTAPAHVSSTLPPEVVTCLKHARFLHLATCDRQIPHVSLMNYTYLPSNPYSSDPTIIMTTNPSSKKTLNLVANPRVSLLVHDWVSHRPPTRAQDARDGSPPPQGTRSSLASMLLNINTSALSRISATLNGSARIVDTGSDEEKWCKQAHLENNTFGENGADGASMFGTSPAASSGDGGRSCFIESEDVRVVVIKISDGRIADFKGSVQDFVVDSNAQQSPVVNGI